MKIFLVLSSIPYDKGEAIDVVSYEVVRLMAEAGHHLIVQVLIRESKSKLSEDRYEYAKKVLAKTGSIQLLPVLYLNDLKSQVSPVSRYFQYIVTAVRSIPPFSGFINPYFFPGMVAKKNLHEQVSASSPDILLSIWSWEALSATYDIKNVPKFVYYGNPDHKPLEAQLRFAELFDMPLNGIVNRIKHGLYGLFNRAREIQHLKMMSMSDTTANNSLVDAEYYRDKGHPHSIYLQNMWPENPAGPVFGGIRETDGILRIAGSVGNLGATGNTFGLNYLGDRLLPELEKYYTSQQLVIDIYGGGKARSRVEKVLDHPCIHLHGWIDDLVSAIHHSQIFLVLTNVDDFIVGNTRILLAWSLGACVIAHSNSALSMPEIKHMENALLADTPEEMAVLIDKVNQDDVLRQRIGRGGYETFRKDYVSDVVIPKMLAAMDECVKKFAGTGA